MIKKGKNVKIAEGVVLGDNITIGNNVEIDCYTVIRDNVTIGDDTYIGSNCILGEHQMDYFRGEKGQHPLHIGSNALIRSGSIIYGDCEIGSNFQTGHRATIREKSIIGEHVSIGTLCDIQGYCKIGNYVRAHSNVHIGQESLIKDFVWLFPYVVLTNDPTPPSDELKGVTLNSFSVISTGSVILPGVTVEGDSLIAAGAIVTKDVKKGDVVGGNPAKTISTVDRIKNHITGEQVYPWRYTFKRGMPWEESDYITWYKEIGRELGFEE